MRINLLETVSPIHCKMTVLSKYFQTLLWAHEEMVQLFSFTWMLAQGHASGVLCHLKWGGGSWIYLSCCVIAGKYTTSAWAVHRWKRQESKVEHLAKEIPLHQDFYTLFLEIVNVENKLFWFELQILWQIWCTEPNPGRSRPLEAQTKSTMTGKECL